MDRPRNLHPSKICTYTVIKNFSINLLYIKLRYNSSNFCSQVFSLHEVLCMPVSQSFPSSNFCSIRTCSVAIYSYKIGSGYSYGHVRISSCYSYGHVRISPCYLYGHVRAIRTNVTMTITYFWKVSIASCYSYGTQYGQASTNTFMFVRLVIARSSRIDTWCMHAWLLFYCMGRGMAAWTRKFTPIKALLALRLCS